MPSKKQRNKKKRGERQESGPSPSATSLPLTLQVTSSPAAPRVEPPAEPPVAGEARPRAQPQRNSEVPPVVPADGRKNVQQPSLFATSGEDRDGGRDSRIEGSSFPNDSCDTKVKHSAIAGMPSGASTEPSRPRSRTGSTPPELGHGQGEGELLGLSEQESLSNGPRDRSGVMPERSHGVTPDQSYASQTLTSGLGTPQILGEHSQRSSMEIREAQGQFMSNYPESQRCEIMSMSGLAGASQPKREDSSSLELQSVDPPIEHGEPDQGAGIQPPMAEAACLHPTTRPPRLPAAEVPPKQLPPTGIPPVTHSPKLGAADLPQGQWLGLGVVGLPAVVRSPRLLAADLPQGQLTTLGAMGLPAMTRSPRSVTVDPLVRQSPRLPSGDLSSLSIGQPSKLGSESPRVGWMRSVNTPPPLSLNSSSSHTTTRGASKDLGATPSAALSKNSDAQPTRPSQGDTIPPTGHAASSLAAKSRQEPATGLPGPAHEAPSEAPPEGLPNAVHGGGSEDELDTLFGEGPDALTLSPLESSSEEGSGDARDVSKYAHEGCLKVSFEVAPKEPPQDPLRDQPLDAPEGPLEDETKAKGDAKIEVAFGELDFEDLCEAEISASATEATAEIEAEAESEARIQEALGELYFEDLYGTEALAAAVDIEAPEASERAKAAEAWAAQAAQETEEAAPAGRPRLVPKSRRRRGVPGGSQNSGSSTPTSPHSQSRPSLWGQIPGRSALLEGQSQTASGTGPPVTPTYTGGFLPPAPANISGTRSADSRRSFRFPWRLPPISTPDVASKGGFGTPPGSPQHTTAPGNRPRSRPPGAGTLLSSHNISNPLDSSIWSPPRSRRPSVSLIGEYTFMPPAQASQGTSGVQPSRSRSSSQSSDRPIGLTILGSLVRSAINPKPLPNSGENPLGNRPPSASPDSQPTFRPPPPRNPSLSGFPLFAPQSNSQLSARPTNSMIPPASFPLGGRSSGEGSSVRTSGLVEGLDSPNAGISGLAPHSIPVERPSSPRSAPATSRIRRLSQTANASPGSRSVLEVQTSLLGASPVGRPASLHEEPQATSPSSDSEILASDSSKRQGARQVTSHNVSLDRPALSPPSRFREFLGLDPFLLESEAPDLGTLLGTLGGRPVPRTEPSPGPSSGSEAEGIRSGVQQDYEDIERLQDFRQPPWPIIPRSRSATPESDYNPFSSGMIDTREWEIAQVFGPSRSGGAPNTVDNYISEVIRDVRGSPSLEEQYGEAETDLKGGQRDVRGDLGEFKEDTDSVVYKPLNQISKLTPGNDQLTEDAKRLEYTGAWKPAEELGSVEEQKLDKVSTRGEELRRITDEGWTLSMTEGLVSTHEQIKPTGKDAVSQSKRKSKPPQRMSNSTDLAQRGQPSRREGGSAGAYDGGEFSQEESGPSSSISTRGLLKTPVTGTRETNFIFNTPEDGLSELHIKSAIHTSRQALQSGDPVKALYWARIAVDCSRKFNFQPILQRSRFWEGVALYKLYEYEDALSSFKEAQNCERIYAEGRPARFFVPRTIIKCSIPFAQRRDFKGPTTFVKQPSNKDGRRIAVTRDENWNLFKHAAFYKTLSSESRDGRIVQTRAEMLRPAERITAEEACSFMTMVEAASLKKRIKEAKSARRTKNVESRAVGPSRRPARSHRENELINLREAIFRAERARRSANDRQELSSAEYSRISAISNWRRNGRLLAKPIIGETRDGKQCRCCERCHCGRDGGVQTITEMEAKESPSPPRDGPSSLGPKRPEETHGKGSPRSGGTEDWKPSKEDPKGKGVVRINWEKKNDDGKRMEALEKGKRITGKGEETSRNSKDTKKKKESFLEMLSRSGRALASSSIRRSSNIQEPPTQTEVEGPKDNLEVTEERRRWSSSLPPEGPVESFAVLPERPQPERPDPVRKSPAVPLPLAPKIPTRLKPLCMGVRSGSNEDQRSSDESDSDNPEELRKMHEKRIKKLREDREADMGGRKQEGQKPSLRDRSADVPNPSGSPTGFFRGWWNTLRPNRRSSQVANSDKLQTEEKPPNEPQMPPRRALRGLFSSTKQPYAFVPKQGSSSLQQSSRSITQSRQRDWGKKILTVVRGETMRLQWEIFMIAAVAMAWSAGTQGLQWLSGDTKAIAALCSPYTHSVSGFLPTFRTYIYTAITSATPICLFCLAPLPGLYVFRPLFDGFASPSEVQNEGIYPRLRRNQYVIAWIYAIVILISLAMGEIFSLWLVRQLMQLWADRMWFVNWAWDAWTG